MEYSDSESGRQGASGFRATRAQLQEPDLPGSTLRQIKLLPDHVRRVFSSPMSESAPARRENWSLIGIFCAAFLVQFYLTARNWTMPFMPGHEFRQAQTAIVSYYIDRQNNFSLLYETPILGKPWIS